MALGSSSRISPSCGRGVVVHSSFAAHELLHLTLVGGPLGSKSALPERLNLARRNLHNEPIGPHHGGDSLAHWCPQVGVALGRRSQKETQSCIGSLGNTHCWFEEERVRRETSAAAEALRIWAIFLVAVFSPGLQLLAVLCADRSRSAFQVTGRPTSEDVDAIKSPFAARGPSLARRELPGGIFQPELGEYRQHCFATTATHSREPVKELMLKPWDGGMTTTSAGSA